MPKKCLAEILFWCNYGTGFRVYIFIFRYGYMTAGFMKLKLQKWLIVNTKTYLPGLDCRAYCGYEPHLLPALFLGAYDSR